MKAERNTDVPAKPFAVSAICGLAYSDVRILRGPLIVQSKSNLTEAASGSTRRIKGKYDEDYGSLILKILNITPDTPSPPLAWPVGASITSQLIRELDWSSMTLGPCNKWPQTLRSTVDLVLNCHFPMIVLWGPDLIQIYNDGYLALMGAKHPAGLGQRTQECWPEVWHINQPL